MDPLDMPQFADLNKLHPHTAGGWSSMPLPFNQSRIVESQRLLLMELILDVKNDPKKLEEAARRCAYTVAEMRTQYEKYYDYVRRLMSVEELASVMPDVEKEWEEEQQFQTMLNAVRTEVVVQAE